VTEPPDPLEATAAETPRTLAQGVVAARPPVQTIGKYRLSRILGSGGMGVVWAAIDPDLERDVAIKLLHGATNEPTLRSRLLREARAMAKLKHPNVLTVYEVGTDDNRDFIAMELVDGDSLEGWLATKPPRAEILAALLAAGRGLVAAHAAGIVHRDFKPHNVLRSRDGHVYVTDFGLARGQLEEGVDIEQLPLAPLPGSGTATAAATTPTPMAAGTQPRRALDSVLDAPLTRTGEVIGTPAYMAPEQFAGRIPDPRSDQFAFCVTAWEALAGTRPFRGSTLAELEVASGGGAPSKMPAAELPSAIRAVLARGLDPEPSKRWPDMAALLDELARVTAPPKRMVLMSALGAFAITAIAIGAIVLLPREGNKGDREGTRRQVVVGSLRGPRGRVREVVVDGPARRPDGRPRRRRDDRRDRDPR
jgi:serine/threonine protein kinase